MNTTAVSSRLTRAAQAIADPASFTDVFLSGAHCGGGEGVGLVAGQVQAVRQAVAA